MRGTKHVRKGGSKERNAIQRAPEEINKDEGFDLEPRLNALFGRRVFQHSNEHSVRRGYIEPVPPKSYTYHGITPGGTNKS